MGRSDASVPVLSPVPEQQNISRAALVERVPARMAARLLGVKIGTLAKWRYLGKGPGGWLRISPTCVVYPVSEISRFLAERTGSEGGEK